eukprot:764995-Pelagomonas_calceolata.AAC.1
MILAQVVMVLCCCAGLAPTAHLPLAARHGVMQKAGAHDINHQPPSCPLAVLCGVMLQGSAHGADTSAGDYLHSRSGLAPAARLPPFVPLEEEGMDNLSKEGAPQALKEE